MSETGASRRPDTSVRSTGTGSHVPGAMPAYPDIPPAVMENWQRQVEMTLEQLARVDTTRFGSVTHCLVSGSLGALTLCSLSALQKTMIGMPLSPLGFLIPFTFGGAIGIIVCFLMRKTRKQLHQLKHSLKELAGAKEAVIQREDALSRLCEELSRKNAEIEHFNHTMIGREDRMIELKNEVNGLSRRLGIEPPYRLGQDETGEDADPAFLSEQDKLRAQRRAAINLLDDMRSAERSIRDNEAKFEALAENSNDVITRFDRDHRHLYVNSAITSLTSMSRGDVIGKTHRELGFPESLVRQWESAIDTVFATGRSHRIEFCFPSGIHVDWQLNPEFSDNGEVTAVITAARDITRHKQTEAELLDSTIKLQQSIKAANIGLWEWHLKTNKVHFSAEWKQQIGYQDHELENSFAEWESRVHPDDLSMVRHLVMQSLKDLNTGYQAEYRLRHKDGSYRWIHAQATKIYVENDRPVRMVGSHLDITRHKQTEQLLKSQVDELSRWHAVTLDREDRVTQLKQEVNDLCQRLGEPLPYEVDYV